MRIGIYLNAWKNSDYHIEKRERKTLSETKEIDLQYTILQNFLIGILFSDILIIFNNLVQKNILFFFDPTIRCRHIVFQYYQSMGFFPISFTVFSSSSTFFFFFKQRFHLLDFFFFGVHIGCNNFKEPVEYYIEEKMY